MKFALATLGLLLAAPMPAQAADGPAVPSVKHFMMGLSVSDMDKMTAWYRDMLGFKVTHDVPMGQGGGKVRFLENGTERIEMVYSPTSKPGPKPQLAPKHAEIQGWVQLTMEVPDLDAAKAALAARGVKPVLDITPIPTLGIRIMFLRDPDDNLVELCQPLKS